MSQIDEYRNQVLEILKQSNNLKIKNKFVKMEKIEICKKNLKKNPLTLKNKKTFMKPQKNVI